MTALERAARAVNDAEAQWSLEPTGTRSEMIARAVLMAVREPDLGTRMIGRNVILRGSGSPYADYSVAVGMGFTAMIDAILNETHK